MCKKKIQKWFNGYKKIIVEKNITDPRCIWNVNESNIVNVPRMGNYIAEVGKPLLQVIGKECAETLTVITCVNTAGEKIPQLIIHRGVCVQESWLTDAPEGVVVKASAKGYVNDKIFHEWGQLFLAHLKKLGLDDDVNVLTFDGHGSHIYNLPLMQDLLHNNVSAITFELHMTHTIQPVDQHPLAIFKRFYLFCLAVWCRKHKGKELQKNQFFKVFWPAWLKSLTERNIKAGFRVTGLWPVDVKAIPEECYTGDNLYSDSETNESETESETDDDDDDDIVDMSKSSVEMLELFIVVL